MSRHKKAQSEDLIKVWVTTFLDVFLATDRLYIKHLQSLVLIILICLQTEETMKRYLNNTDITINTVETFDNDLANVIAKLKVSLDVHLCHFKTRNVFIFSLITHVSLLTI